MAVVMRGFHFYTSSTVHFPAAASPPPVPNAAARCDSTRFEGPPVTISHRRVGSTLVYRPGGSFGAVSAGIQRLDERTLEVTQGKDSAKHNRPTMQRKGTERGVGIYGRHPKQQLYPGCECKVLNQSQGAPPESAPLRRQLCRRAAAAAETAAAACAAAADAASGAGCPGSCGVVQADARRPAAPPAWRPLSTLRRRAPAGRTRCAAQRRCPPPLRAAAAATPCGGL